MNKKNTIKSVFLIFTLFITLFVFVGCQTAKDPTLSFDKTSYEVEVGETVKLNPAIANLVNGVVEYKLDKEGIVAAKEGNKFEAVAAGEVKITASLKGYDAITVEITIVVKEKAAVEYTVTFAETGETVKVKEGEKVAKPADPEKEGYEFKGWFTDEALTVAYDFDQAVVADLTLYAKWEEVKVEVEYTVTFAETGETVKVKEGEKVAKPADPTKEGYEFKGWFTDEALTIAYDFDQAVVADLTLYAKWEEVEYTVKFAETGETVKVKEGEKVAKPADPEKEGYEFKGWYLDKTLTIAYDFDKVVEANITLYAKWIKLSFNEKLAISKIEALALLNGVVGAIDKNLHTEEELEVINNLVILCEKNINSATTFNEITELLNETLKQIDELLGNTIEYANGVYSFVSSSYAERTEILAVLEKYAVEHFLTGFTFMDDGGYTLYSPDIKKGTDDYIIGYGYGILSDGQILNPLAAETNDAWKYYYHTYISNDPSQINYGDDKGSVVGGLVGYVSGSYWKTKMNDTKDGYVWYSELAKEKPVPVNANEKTGLASIYEWKLKTEKDGFVYNTLTTNETLAKYAGQGVKAEDYLTSYKMLFTQANGWARGAETLDGAGAIKGAHAYYNQSANGYNAAAWENVGLKVEERDGEWVMTVEFVQPCTRFNAIQYLSSAMYAPLPEAFVTDLGKVAGAAQGEEWAKGCALFGKTNIELGLTPVDTFLSTGPYVLEAWETEKQIVFKKNALYEDGGRYQIAGIHYNILTAAKTDNEAGLKEFLAGKIHACDIPSTQLRAYKNDPRAVFIPGESNFKLNVNSCDEETWEFLFGENGLITQTAEEDYWDLKPAMSNRDFLLGLSYALDRKKVADSLGVGPMIDYFGNGYLSDPENGIVYNQTEAHKNAIADLIATGDGYGYDKETAIAYFQKAAAYFLENGIYNEGDVIEIEIAWMYQSQIEPYGAPIAECFESVFNDPQVCGKKLTLKINNMAVTRWSDVYYNKMMVGQYDLAFGSISGTKVSPLYFLEVLKSDNSSGLTLNWGAITSEVNLEYNGELWSFDSLWQAAETGGYFENGEYVKPHATEIVSAELNADGTVTMVLDSNMLIGVEGVEVEIKKAYVSGYNSNKHYVQYECEFTVDEEGIVTVTIDKEAYNYFKDNNYYASAGHRIMIDLEYSIEVLDVLNVDMDSCDYLLDDLIGE